MKPRWTSLWKGGLLQRGAHKVKRTAKRSQIFRRFEGWRPLRLARPQVQGCPTVLTGVGWAEAMLSFWICIFKQYLQNIQVKDPYHARRACHQFRQMNVIESRFTTHFETARKWLCRAGLPIFRPQKSGHPKRTRPNLAGAKYLRCSKNTRVAEMGCFFLVSNVGHPHTRLVPCARFS